jgi:hypothetical protein
MLDENEFLSPHGIRSLSRMHNEKPYVFRAGNEEFRVDYVPGEGNSYLFGGNSNWRGPIWFPINFLIVEALERYHLFYGESFKVECPTGSGNMMTLQQVARELARRLGSIFLPDESGVRPCHGDIAKYADDPHWRDLILFHEYFHGETGRGCGASHQTGWTALAVKLLENTMEHSNRSEQIRREAQSDAPKVRGAISSQHVYEIRPRKDRRGLDLISDRLPLGLLRFEGADAFVDAVNYAKFCSPSHAIIIRLFDESGAVIETHELDTRNRLVTSANLFENFGRRFR